MVIRPYVVAGCAVAPLIAASMWSGFTLGLSDPVLGALSPDEQPLSIRSNGGPWAALLVLGWFSLAYGRRNLRGWGPALIVLGTLAALLRAGNLWLLGLALVVPLAHQLDGVTRPQAIVLAATSLGMAVATTLFAQPSHLPRSAPAAVAPQATVLADWRWAADLQRSTRANVLDAGGLRARPIDFWIDYLRVVEGHERWPAILRALGVDTVVLSSRDNALAAELLRTSPEWRVISETDGALVAERTR